MTNEIKRETTREDRQKNIAEWCAAAFGSEQAESLPQRGIRLLEEAAEVAQATTVDLVMAHKMIDYVWSRPSGLLYQELGGVGVTILALANAAGLDADDCEAREVQRVLSKPIEHFTQRNQAKNDAGFLAKHPAPSAPSDATVENFDYLYPQLPTLRDELEKMWHGAKDEHRAWLYRDSMRSVVELMRLRERFRPTGSDASEASA